MNIANVYHALSEAILDSSVGISLAELGGDERNVVFCSEISAGQSLNAHYHQHGEEHYQVVEGEGAMTVGEVIGGCRVQWGHPIPVSKGDFFTIKEGQAHQLSNNSSASLVMIFSCPKSHITTDRILITGSNILKIEDV